MNDLEDKIKEKLNSIDIDQRVENAINQSIAHVLGNNLNAGISKKIFDYIENNFERIGAKIVYKMLNEKLQYCWQSKIEYYLRIELREIIREWVNDKIKFEIKPKD